MRRGMLIAGGLFFLSGACALSYQVVWIKLLTLQFGSSAWSISTVVAAFMAGLGLGSWWAGRHASSLPRPLRSFAWLELGILLCGLLSLPVLDQLDRLISPLYQALENRFALFVLARFLLSFALLLGPTLLMGASLPVLVAGYARLDDRPIHFQRVVGWLYGINTLGAALGTLLTGFFLLPQLAIAGTLAVAVAAGLVVVGVALAADRQTAPNEAPDDGKPPGRPSRGLLAAVFLTGALALFYEIGWTRLLTPVLGSSTYAFSVILATYLLGLGAGSLAAGRWAPAHSQRACISVLTWITSLSVAVGLLLASQLPSLFTTLARAVSSQVWLLFCVQALTCAALLLVPTLAMGAILPLAIAADQAGHGDSGRAVGGIYAANTLGSILGSLLAGFVAIPVLGISSAMLGAAASGLGVGAALLQTEPGLTRARRSLWGLGGAAGALLLLLLATEPKVDMARLHAGVFRSILKPSPNPGTGDLLFTGEGISSTVTVFRNANTTWMKVNGKTDASSAGDLATQYLLGHLPMFLSPRPRDVCVIGLGSGATVRAVAAHPVRSVDVVELEPQVVTAAGYFHSVNDEVLADPRVRVHIEDGRSFLRYRESRYDVIISEPSNPWIAGVSALFTSEFYGMVRERLAPGGVFCQWIQVYELSDTSLRVMLRTLGDAFGHVAIFVSLRDLVCVASDKPLSGTAARYARRFKIPGVRQTLKRVRIDNAYELLSSYLASLPEDAARYPTTIRNTDHNLWLEYRAPIEMYSGSTPNIPTIPHRAWFERFATRLFPDLARPEVARNLGGAIALRTPHNWRLIGGLAKLAASEAQRARFEKLREVAQQRAREVQGNGDRIGRARKLLDLGNPLAAVKLLKRVIESEPHRATAHRLLGEHHYRARRWAEAEAAFQQALAHRPDNYEVHANLGSLYYLIRNDAKRGRAHFEKALRLNPYYVRARAVWIAMLMSRKEQAEADRVYLEANRILDIQQRKTLDAEIARISKGMARLHR